MINNYIGERDIVTFSKVINMAREFFLKKGFVEVNTQDRLSILAACEDPFTVRPYEFNGEIWPLPQTGQMWLEYELLSKPELLGVFCVSTSFREEPNPVPGRHKLVFPMLEFETKGDINTLVEIEAELLEHLGFGEKDSFIHKTYNELKEHYGVHELENEHESKMKEDFGNVVFMEHFPIYTSPFWNMKKADKNYSHKIDVIINGQETIGSAERATNKDEMRSEFYTIMDGKYAKKLFDLFGKERVEKELEEYLSFDFFPRVGAGIGVTRLVDAYKEKSRT